MSLAAPSPLAHGPNDVCPSCTECRSCDGGHARIPLRYRVVLAHLPGDGIEARAHCTVCDGRHVECLNLIPQEPAP